jgi:hypothetical protein
MDKLLPGPTETLIRDFARELAIEIETFDEVCKKFGKTEDEGNALRAHPNFQAYYDTARAEWNASHNSTQQGEVLSAVAYRELIPHMFGMAHNPSTPETAAVKIFEVLQKGGRIGERGVTGGGNAGEAVKITINLGDRSLNFEKDPPIITIENDKIEATA